MIRGLYISAAGMSTQMRNQEVISNNLANVDTSGFKKDNLIVGSFADMLISRINDSQDHENSPVIGKFALGSQAQGTAIDMSKGAIINTQRKTDFAINGTGMFVIETPNGERYTRDGSFLLDKDSRLVTSEGYQVMGENGPIETGGQDFEVGRNGEIIVNGNVANRMLIVDLDPAQLNKQGESLFSLSANGQANPGENYSIEQGFLESSNVNTVREMVNMISGFRVYEASQKALTAQDETLAKLISEGSR